MSKPVLLIRANRNEEDAAALEKFGIPSLVDPYLEIRPAEDAGDALELLSILENAATPIWLFATSVNAISYWAKLVGEDPLRSAISNNRQLKFAAIGQATAGALRSLGAVRVVLPPEQSGASLAEFLTSTEPAGYALIPGGNIAMKTLPSKLLAAGWKVRAGIVYNTTRIESEPKSAQLVRNREVSAVLFRSPSAVRALLHFIPKPEVPLICAGSTTAAALRDFGLAPSAVSVDASAEVVASTISSLIFQERKG